MRSEEDIRYQITQLEGCSVHDSSILKALVYVLQWVLCDHEGDPRSNLDYVEHLLDEFQDMALVRMEQLKERSSAILEKGDDVVTGLKYLLEEVRALREEL